MTEFSEFFRQALQTWIYTGMAILMALGIVAGLSQMGKGKQ